MSHYINYDLIYPAYTSINTTIYTDTTTKQDKLKIMNTFLLYLTAIYRISTVKCIFFMNLQFY